MHSISPPDFNKPYNLRKDRLIPRRQRIEKMSESADKDWKMERLREDEQRSRAYDEEE